MVNRLEKQTNKAYEFDSYSKCQKVIFSLQQQAKPNMKPAYLTKPQSQPFK